MIELRIKEQINTDYIADIYDDNEYAGGIEFNYEHGFYIQNIKKDTNYKKPQLLKRVIEHIREKYKCSIGCTPLEKYIPYYKDLGFIPMIDAGHGTIYHLPYVET